MKCLVVSFVSLYSVWCKCPSLLCTNCTKYCSSLLFIIITVSELAMVKVPSRVYIYVSSFKSFCSFKATAEHLMQITLTTLCTGGATWVSVVLPSLS